MQKEKEKKWKKLFEVEERYPSRFSEWVQSVSTGSNLPSLLLSFFSEPFKKPQDGAEKGARSQERKEGRGVKWHSFEGEDKAQSPSRKPSLL